MRRSTLLVLCSAGCTLGPMHYPEVGSNNLGWSPENGGQIVNVAELQGAVDTGGATGAADTGASDTGASDTGDTGASDTGASDTGGPADTGDTGAVAP